MSDWIRSVLQWTAEWKAYQSDGLYSLELVAVATIAILTVPELYYLRKQNQKIWDGKSGDSISVTLFAANCWAFMSFGLYYLHLGGVIATTNGVLSSLIQLPLLYGLWKFKQLRWWETLLFFLFPLMPAAMLLAPADIRSALVLGITILLVATTADQPLELLRKRRTGVVDIKLFAFQTFNCLVWLTYVVILDDPVLIVCQILVTLMNALVVSLWCWYRAKELDVPRVLKPLTALQARWR